jgi:hypothetical protein
MQANPGVRGGGPLARRSHEGHPVCVPEATEEPWYAVRCVFRFDFAADAGESTYEERITLWSAPSFDVAIARAEQEATDYVSDGEGEYVGLAQAFHLSTAGVGDGAEVFSLMRDSRLMPDEYLTRFFDTGRERQTAT